MWVFSTSDFTLIVFIITKSYILQELGRGGGRFGHLQRPGLSRKVLSASGGEDASGRAHVHQREPWKYLGYPGSPEESM